MFEKSTLTAEIVGSIWANLEGANSDERNARRGRSDETISPATTTGFMSRLRQNSKVILRFLHLKARDVNLVTVYRATLAPLHKYKQRMGSTS